MRASRRYVRLPADAELVALWRANAENNAATSKAIGCSESAVALAIKRIGIDRLIPRPYPVRTSLKGRTEELERRVAALTAAVAALEARPGGSVTIVEWRPDHRRQVDGGKPVRQQRREMGLPRRLEAAS